MDPHQIAQHFSRHRFSEVYPLLSPGVRWVLPGQEPIEGRAAVVAACDAAAAEMATLVSVEFTRFVSVASEGVAAVDAIAHYMADDGTTSVVSSADVYEFNGDGLLTTITSYAVELDPGAWDLA